MKTKTKHTRYLTVDACPDASGFWTIRPNDGTEHGDTEVEPIATVYAHESIADLLAAAPRLLEERDALLTFAQSVLEWCEGDAEAGLDPSLDAACISARIKKALVAIAKATIK